MPNKTPTIVRQSSRQQLLALAGALAAWLVGLVVDSLRWRASTIVFSCPAVPVKSLERLVQDLRTEGVEAVLELGQISGIEGDTPWQIRSLMRHRDVMEQRQSHLCPC